MFVVVSLLRRLRESCLNPERKTEQKQSETERRRWTDGESVGDDEEQVAELSWLPTLPQCVCLCVCVIESGGLGLNNSNVM